MLPLPALLRMVPATAWMLAGGLALAAVGGWHYSQTRAAREAGRAEVRAQWDQERAINTAAALTATQAARTEEQRRVAAHQETANEAERLSTRARSGAAAAAVAGDGLRQRAATVAAACGPARSDPVAAGAGASADDPGRMLADVLGRMETAGRELAAEADRRGIAGRACERAYGALKPAE